MIIAELFSKYKINKIYANRIQNLDKSYCYKFFLKEPKREAACDRTTQAVPVMARFLNECNN